MRLRRQQKSRKQQVAERLKLDTAGKAAKDATKAAKGTAVYKVAEEKRFVKRIPIVLGAIGAALLATRFVRGRGEASPA